MSAMKTLRGADILVYINGTLYPKVRDISYSIDWGEYEIYGIDDPFPQEIAPGGRVSSRGKINGLKLRSDGNLQGAQIRSLATSLISAPYNSLRIVDRVTKEDIVFWPRLKFKDESWSIPAKRTIQLSFSFIGLRPLQPLDRVKGTTKEITTTSGR
jgi:hypothetical protein